MPDRLRSSPSPDKERTWQKERALVDTLADGAGMPIDEGIKEAVTALRVLGINTVSSHEGKMDRYAVPFIDIEAAGTEESAKQLREPSSTDDADEEAENESPEKAQLRLEIMRKNAEELKKLFALLEGFYANRQIPYEVRLSTEHFALGRSRLQSQGAAFQMIETDEQIKLERLRQFQGEMQAFTEFLKQKFLES